MAFKDLMGKAQELAGVAAGAASDYLDEFNTALPTLQALGFSVRDFNVGMGLIPEVGATLVASIDNVNVSKLNELIEKNQEKKALVALLKALQAAYNIKQQVPDLQFQGIELDVKLGLPPHAGVKFLRSAPAGEAAGLGLALA